MLLRWQKVLKLFFDFFCITTHRLGGKHFRNGLVVLFGQDGQFTLLLHH